jgi:hypothetical protein
MAELRVATRLTVNNKPSSKQSPQSTPRFQGWQLSARHSDGQVDPQLFRVRLCLARNQFARLPHPTQMALDRITSHPARLVERAPVCNQARQCRDRNLVTNASKRISCPTRQALSPPACLAEIFRLPDGSKKRRKSVVRERESLPRRSACSA